MLHNIVQSYSRNFQLCFNLDCCCFQDIGNYLGTDNELASYSAHVRSYESYLYGVDRNDIHYVPYYTKSHISNMLLNYHERLAIYKDNLDRMESSKESQEEVLKVTQWLLGHG